MSRKEDLQKTSPSICLQNIETERRVRGITHSMSGYPQKNLTEVSICPQALKSLELSGYIIFSHKIHYPPYSLTDHSSIK